MNARETRMIEITQFLDGLLGNGLRSRIGCNSFNGGKAFLQIVQNLYKVPRLMDEIIRILKEYVLFSRIKPQHGTPVTFRKAVRVLQDRIGQSRRHLSAQSLIPGKGFYVGSNFPDRIDISLDILHRAQAEPLASVRMAELTAIPRAVSGDPEQEAIGFARGSDRTLFKENIRHLSPDLSNGEDGRFEKFLKVIGLDLEHEKYFIFDP